jgi:hypothetical protein
MNDVVGAPILDRRGWRGDDLQEPSDWVVELSTGQRDGLKQLADQLPSSSELWLNADAVENTPTEVQTLINQTKEELAFGRGFTLIRGADAADAERLRRVFWTLGVAVGNPVMQNAKGEVLSIVADRFAGAQRGRDTRGYESNDELRFHCDGGDCIAMCCIRQAPRGGMNGLVSLFSIYNEMLSNHPEHLEVLKRGYALYSRKEKGDTESTKNLGKVQQNLIPVFAWHEGRMSTWLNIQLAEIAAEVSEGGFSEADRAALTCVEAVANQPGMQLTFMQQPGDMLFINNLAVMHRRDKFFDSANPEERRSLYRMWINLGDGQPVVPAHAALRRGIRGPSPAIASL